MAYATYADYVETGGTGAERDVLPMLDAASDAIDALTFNRIPAIGWERLTDFQRGKVVKACCKQAAFLYENEDAVASAMSRYSINGVSMEFGNAALYRVVGGVPVSNEAYRLLAQTGLTCLMARGSEVEPCGGRAW